MPLFIGIFTKCFRRFRLNFRRVRRSVLLILLVFVQLSHEIVWAAPGQTNQQTQAQVKQLVDDLQKDPRTKDLAGELELDGLEMLDPSAAQANLTAALKQVRVRIMDALLSPEPKVSGMHEEFFARPDQDNFVGEETFRNRINYVGLMFDPRFWNAHRKWGLLQIELSSDEKKQYAPIVEIGKEFKELRLKELWDETMFKDPDTSRIYLAAEKLFQMSTQINRKYSIAPINHQRAVQLGRDVFTKIFHHSNPDPASTQQKRFFNRIVNRFANFHEEPKAITKVIPRLPTKSEIRIRCAMLQALIDSYRRGKDYTYAGNHNIYKNQETPVSSNYILYFKKRFVDEIEFNSDRVEREIENGMVISKNSLDTWRRLLRTLTSARIYLVLSAFSIGKLESDEFHQFAENIKWAGLKKSPDYWKKRDAQAEARHLVGQAPHPMGKAKLWARWTFVKTVMLVKLLALCALLFSGGKTLVEKIDEYARSSARSDYSPYKPKEKSWIDSVGATLAKAWDKLPNMSQGSSNKDSQDKSDDSQVDTRQEFNRHENSQPKAKNPAKADQEKTPIYLALNQQGQPVADGWPFLIDGSLGERAILTWLPVGQDFKFETPTVYDRKVIFETGASSSEIYIPTSLGFRLIALSSGKDQFKVYQRNGVYYLGPIKGHENLKLPKDFTAYFVADPDSMATVLPNELQDLPKTILKEIAKELKDIGLKDISEEISKNISVGGKISITDLPGIIAGKSHYTLQKLEPSKTQFYGNNHFQNFSEYALDGSLYGDCKIGNRLLAQILSYLKLDSRFEVRLVGELLAENGKLKFPGHAEVEIYFQGELVARLDATPQITESKSKKSVSSKSNSAEQSKPDKDSAEDKTGSNTRSRKVSKKELQDLVAERSPKKSLSSEYYRWTGPWVPPRPRRAQVREERDFETEQTEQPLDSEVIFSWLVQIREDDFSQKIEQWKSGWDNYFKQNVERLLEIFKSSKLSRTAVYPHNKLLRLATAFRSILVYNNFDAERFSDILGKKSENLEQLNENISSFLDRQLMQFDQLAENISRDRSLQKKFGHLFTVEYRGLLFDSFAPKLREFLPELAQRSRIIPTKRFNAIRTDSGSAALAASRENPGICFRLYGVEK